MEYPLMVIPTKVEMNLDILSLTLSFCLMVNLLIYIVISFNSHQPSTLKSELVSMKETVASLQLSLDEKVAALEDMMNTDELLDEFDEIKAQIYELMSAREVTIRNKATGKPFRVHTESNTLVCNDVNEGKNERIWTIERVKQD
jgi:hypothetical protein